MIPHLLDIVRALMLGAAVMAVLLARRVPEHRPVAVFLGVQSAVMLARWALLEFYLRGAIAAAGGDVATALEPAPLHGWPLVAGVAMNAGWLAWPAGLAMVALWVFREQDVSRSILWHAAVRLHRDRVTREVLGSATDWQRAELKSVRIFIDALESGRFAIAMPALAWVVVVAMIAVTYPAGRPLYPKLFAGAEVAAMVTSLGSAGSWAMRVWGREGLGIARGCVVFMVGCGAVSLAGPYVHGIFTTWWLANAVQLVMYSGLILVQGGALWVSR